MIVPHPFEPGPVLSLGGNGNGPTENPERGGMACATCHAVDGELHMFGAQSPDEVIGRVGRSVGLRRRSDQGFGERQAAAACRWLQDDVDVLSTSEAMWKKDVAGALGEA